MSCETLIPTDATSQTSTTEVGTGHALMRMTGFGMQETIDTLHQEPVEALVAEDVLAEVLQGEAIFSGIAQAPFLLPVHYFGNLVAGVTKAGVIPVVRHLDACMQAVSRFENELPMEGRVGPSLAPFAKGILLLAVAEAMREEKPVVAEMIFGANGRAHAAALRQMMNPTQNKQAHRRKTSLDLLRQLPNAMALEAWRAFEVWAMVSPDEKTLQGLLAELEGAPDPWSPGYAEWRQATLAGLGQAHLTPILAKEVEVLSVFGMGAPVVEAQRQLLVDIIRNGLFGRSTMRPSRPGTQFSAYQTISGWRFMAGKEDGIALAGELCSDLVLSGAPFPLYGLPDTTAAEEYWVVQGLELFTRSFHGTPEFPTVYAMFAALMTEWDRLNRHPAASNTAMQPRAAIIADNLDRVAEVLALLDEKLPLEHAPWVEAQGVISAMGVALVGFGGNPAIRSALGEVIAYADARGIDPT